MQINGHGGYGSYLTTQNPSGESGENHLRYDRTQWRLCEKKVEKLRYGPKIHGPHCIFGPYRRGSN